MENTAFGIIDGVKCFFPDEGKWENEPGFGELPVPGGEAVVAPINEITVAAKEADMEIFNTEEAHPEETAHFAQTPEQPNFVNTWPPHGRDDTPGAELHPDLLIAQDLTLTNRFIKGDVAATSPEDDTSYTGALAHDRKTGELLPDYLRRKKVVHVILAGLALGDGKEHPLCVDSTAIDFRAEGFEVTVVTDAVEAVLPENKEKCFRNLGELGIKFATTQEILEQIRAA